MTKKYATRANLATRIEIVETLKGVLSPRDDNSDFWRYAPGWSDFRVAQEVSERMGLDEDLTALQVRNVRVELFGLVEEHNKKRKVVSAANKDVDVVERLNRIETKLNELARAVEGLY